MSRQLFGAIGLGLGAVLCCSAALAAEPDDATRAGVRDLGYAGVKAFEQGDYATAVSKLSRAYDVLKVPTLGLWLGRALARSGKLVEANERYLDVTRLSVPEGDKLQQQAQADAQREHDELTTRIPSLVLDAGGVSAAELTVSIDGAVIPPAFIGEARPVNPGSHRIEITRGGQTTADTVSIKEGERLAVKLKVPGAGPTPPMVPPAPTPAADAPAPATKRSSSARTVGWVALGVGGGGIVLGAVTGGLALSKRNTLDCPDDSCTRDKQSDVDTYNTFRTVSSVGFIAGAVLAVAGGILVFTSPRSDAPTTARIVPVIDIDRVGVRGTF